MSNNDDKLVPWARIKLLSMDGYQLSIATLEFKDNYQEDRMRFYRLADSEFMMVQIAMTALAHLYGPSPVCITINDKMHNGVCGDDFIEFLDIMKSMREENGTFYKLNEVIHLLQDEIENLKRKEPELTATSKTHAGRAKYYWKAACDALMNKLELLRDDLNKNGY